MCLGTPSIILNSIQKDRPPSIHWQVSFSLELILCNAIDHRHDIYLVFLTQLEVIFRRRPFWPQGSSSEILFFALKMSGRRTFPAIVTENFTIFKKHTDKSNRYELQC